MPFRLTCCLILLLLPEAVQAQFPVWTTPVDSVAVYSSPQAADLNQDGILDIVIGAGVEPQGGSRSILALDGRNGDFLWTVPARDQIFGTALFRDLNQDQVPDVLIGGRAAQFMALDGLTGQVLWEFWPDSLGPAAPAGWYNFYNPQWVPDQDADGLPDLLISNGGDANAIAFDSLRPAGKLLLLRSADGSILAQDTMPDGHETYFSPLLHPAGGSGDPWIIYGSGGETVRGKLWAARLSELAASDLSQSQVLRSDSLKGFIASPSLVDLNRDAVRDLVVPVHNGGLVALDGANFTPLWALDFPGYEDYVAPAIGQFTGDDTPDIFGIVARGQWSFYADYLMFVVDGATGQIAWTDTATHYQLSQPNAVDWDGDGFDEVLLLRNEDIGFATLEYRNQFQVLDFRQDTQTRYGLQRNGLNVFSTPLLRDLDGDERLELVFAYHPARSAWNGPTGARVERIDLGLLRSTVAWPGYMGRDRDAVYHPPAAVHRPEAQGYAPQGDIFPHPVREQFTVTGALPRRVRLLDLQGRVLREIRHRRNMDVADLSAGVYLVEVSVSRGLWRKKIVIF